MNGTNFLLPMSFKYGEFLRSETKIKVNLFLQVPEIEPLPPDWSMLYYSGRVCFVDHNTRTVTWVRTC